MIYLSATIKSSNVFNVDEDSYDLNLLGPEKFHDLIEAAHCKYKLSDTIIISSSCVWYEIDKFINMIMNKFVSDFVTPELIKYIDGFCSKFSTINEDKRHGWYNIMGVIPGMAYYDYDTREYIIVYLTEYNGFMISFSYCSQYHIDVRVIASNLKNIS